MNFKNYYYSYKKDNKNHYGISCHESDNEAIKYYQSLEKNGHIKIHSLKRDENEIWESTFLVRRLPFNKDGAI